MSGLSSSIHSGWSRLAAGVVGFSAVLSAGSVAWAVDGPVASDLAYRFVAQVESEGRACSGVLVDPRWLLTAKDCLPTAVGQPLVAGVPAAPVWVTVGSLDVRQSARVAVVEVAPHPDRDVALVRLATPVDAQVVPVVLGGSPVAGESVMVAGFGRTGSEWVPDRVHMAGVSVGAVTATGLSLTGDAAVVCQGDAGAPVVRAANGRLELVGVVDAAFQGGCLDATDARRGAAAVRADGLAGWVRRYTAVPLPVQEVAGNLLRDATVSVSSSAENWGWFKTQANDGVRDVNGWSSWGSDTVDHTEWVQFDFPNGQVRSVNRVDLYPRVDAPYTGVNFPADFTVEAWVNNAWQVVVTRTGYPKPASGQKFRFPVVSTSRLRVVGTKLRSMQFDEVEAYDSPNLAADAVVSASSSAENWGWYLTDANDGVRDQSGWTSWPPQTAAHTEWVQLAFPNNESRRIDRVDLFARVDPGYVGVNFPKDFTIDAWVDNAWRTVVSRTGYPNPGDQAARFAFEPVTTTKIRVQGVVTDSMQLNEVEIYAVAPSEPTIATQVLPDWPSASVVEDGAYPGAAAIEAAHPEVHLVGGDGHIVFGDCTKSPAAGVGRIRVEISSATSVCFDVLAASGVLNLRVPGVEQIDARKAGAAGGKSATANIQPEGGVVSTVVLSPNYTTPVGKGVRDDDPATTLLQLVVKAT